MYNFVLFKVNKTTLDFDIHIDSGEFDYSFELDKLCSVFLPSKI